MDARRWTVTELATTTAGLFRDRGIENARLDADLLLAEVLGWARIDLYTRFDMPVEDDDRARYREFVRRRLRREPLAYILGRRAFLDHDFLVGPGVLIPRPETEDLVLTADRLLEGRPPARILEIGVGSGCILLSLLARRADASGVGIDLSTEALEWARKNRSAMGLDERAQLEPGDLFACRALEAGGEASFDLIVSNPPYITEAERDDLMPDVRDFEPAAALFDRDPSGLGFHRRILEEGRAYLKPDGAFVFELPGRGGDDLVRHLASTQPALQPSVRQDLAGLDRVFVASR
ncbi:MAG: peptide chain release factor N(5)-glutamine methyltransferase [Planctomycetes bacterium]|nr:peptide chain release factor N(5)-glutamine methyltransferase [Planctomycetota bacterium]